ncbi:MAG: hypothetical protein KatS3mg090_0695 [Patescibacteria group bacterium]|nr:MAG: hypothetical protein KatS3mg090_0695 [Patescibacteria group bacterium]
MNNSNYQPIGIIGFGRFGQLLAQILSPDFKINILQHKTTITPKDNNLTIFTKPKDFYNNSKTIFFAVPIRKFEQVLKNHKKYINEDHILIDVLSVKTYPAKILKQEFNKRKNEIILTHPMFGPDSAKFGLSQTKLVMYPLKKGKSYDFWKSFFSKKGCQIIEIPPEEHDYLAAKSQGITHFIGRLLQKINFTATKIDTLGAKKLSEIMQQVCNDSWELFYDLQTLNPYTKKVRIEIGKAYDQLYNQLLPKKVSKQYTVFGIQGGKGSFNEEAVLSHIKKNKIKKYKIKYLYTTEKVLKTLHKGDIDYGLFAVHNSLGGIVWESARALAKYKVKIVGEFPIEIRHFLMIRKDINLNSITTIIAHPQVIKQCKGNLSKKYPHLKTISGKGDLIDTAACAKALSQDKLPKDYAILGPKRLANLYNLKIVDSNLQDAKNNLTYFFLVKLNR